MQKTVICLTGPTAAGKSAATHAIAAEWPVEIIVMDSATIYRQMDIGTAKPSAEEQASIPHHLLDIRDPAESYSAAAFVSDAQTLIDAIFKRGNYPLLCGGTLLYYKALREGLSDLPESRPDIRAQLDHEALLQGWPAMHAQLAHVDPVTAARLAPNDSQRIQRALEVYRISGRPLSSWILDAKPAPKGASLHYHTVSLEPSQRQVLHARIAARYQTMIEQGLLGEVDALYERGDLGITMPSIRCVGYRQIWDYLEGSCSLDEAIEKAIIATRQLAKRQLTWLRSDAQREVIDCLDEHRAAKVVQSVSQHWPLT
ncbi:tRNA (adenosine(37)-N6)-dimethylallyltransferase MiaA [Paenalcaligenes niemegkensis]|uniref:tRNA (adenosine(37)-N6)-dimethylallyltransferase MiaA n=1 Tax=Paenalcaligenes niemegkensis TaxID=2895469 RepID=UPI001EE7BDDB|nr:tRNA (adenosine(37)-N6)-dimethylallyltransferase MiaA [Paenalcaligenes niemegkensis]MCQ9615848.1 tRNA (adenosine(37)-N6)-dimethylallyltransferase MiaA [Paenalcaligenes niemegkensis]